MAQLFIVVQKADRAEHETEHENENVSPLAVRHAGEADRETNDRNGDDEHQPAHRGRAGLAHVPRGAVLPDRLPGFDFPQIRYQNRAYGARYTKSDDKRQKSASKSFFFPCLSSFALSGALRAFGKIVRDDLALVHVDLLVADDLIILVALAAEQDDVARLMMVDRPADGLRRSQMTL